MPRSRVLSFMSQWGAPRSPTSEGPPSPITSMPPQTEKTPPPASMPPNIDTVTPQAQAQKLDSDVKNSPTRPPSRARGDSRARRPNSMMQTYQPPQVDVASDTPPELQPIFSFLNSHSNKLYQEGYFLKLHDLDSRGRPSPDRVWNECFAQLVGTVLSLWDAAALDAAGEDGEVVPTFVNLSDASLKMIESLPMNGAQGGNLQNVLSISTAANNRYLLHFNSLNSLTQWTAGIRLAMFEHSTLQEAYTGSLIAGKGKLLNNIKQIMERSKFAHEDWARVRFGAGTPWKRCWCVIAPPDEKEYQKAQKTLKKGSAYDRVKVPKGEIKFYDTRKVTKKTRPIATISDAFAAYAIYPQSKPLIDQSTLVKLEGLVSVHGSMEATTEGFVFVMPEVHPAVTGFEMMLRWLFPVFDIFNLYGRPNRLIADTLDQRGLMFAMPTDRRYGYLDILDVSALIHTEGSQAWSERQWRREMKKLTATRMNTQVEESPRSSRQISQRRNTTTSRTSVTPSRGGVRFDDGADLHSAPGSRSQSPIQFAGQENLRFQSPRRTDSAPPGAHMSPHKRSVSDAQGYRRYESQTPSRLSYEASRTAAEAPPPPPKHGGPLAMSAGRPGGPGSLERITSGTEVPTFASIQHDIETQQASPNLPPPEPVLSPPAFTHSPNSRPANQPYQAPELRRAHSNVDAATLYQMQHAVRRDESPDGEEEWSDAVQRRQQNPVASNTFAEHDLGKPADRLQGILNDVSNKEQHDRDPRQRLSNFPGSPNIGGYARETLESPEQLYVTGQMDGTAGTPPPVPLHANRSIARKPIPKTVIEVPARSDSLPAERVFQAEQEPTSPDSPVSNHSWAGAVMDDSALEAILNEEGSRSDTMQTTQSSEPDYASTVSSAHEEKKSIERPRAGKLKTVGDPDLLVADSRSSGAGRLDTWNKEQSEQSAEVPSVDFGPTFTYKPNSRPNTSGTITPMMGDRSRSGSRDHLRGSSRDRLSRITPTESIRHSYFGGMPAASPRATTPSGMPGDRHSIAWQPAATTPVGAQADRRSVTPQEWVQQRAAMAAVPQQAPPRKPTPTWSHQRTASGEKVDQLRRSLTKTPPLSRTPSGDWTQLAPQRQQRTPPSRPKSRGAGTYLDQAPNGMTTGPTNLTAKEQMHVARATGTPLINYTSNADKRKQEEFQPGLFGALAAREREKDELKKANSSRHRMSNPMLQQAIAMRQQQQHETGVQAQAQYALQMQQQAAQQAHAMQMQQLQYQQMMMSQGQAPVAYGPQGQRDWQRPNIQSHGSWQQQPPYGQGFGMPSPGAQSPDGGFPMSAAQRAWDRQQTPHGASAQQWHQQQ